MTAAFRLSLAAAAVLLAASTAQADEPASGATAPAAGAMTPRFDAGPQDACFGDRYERDEDLRTGYELTEEEILRIINGEPPGV